MNGLPYYKAYPRDFIEGTIGMPFEMKGAYRLLLDLIYMQGGNLQDDPRYISGLLGCSVRAWNGYRKSLIELGKITAENGIISNFRADKELIILRTLQDKQRQNAAGSRKNNNLDEATASPKPSHTEPEPEPYKKEQKVLVLQSPDIEQPKPDPVAEGFKEFWEQIWPRHERKVAKADCLKVYTAACNGSHPKAEKIDPATLNRAARAYIASIRDMQYLKQPFYWLKQPGWEPFLNAASDQITPEQQRYRDIIAGSRR
jgi:uncharacterized protein YdaU (DUF1376 family)